jgi:copper chaperone CopZ
MRTSIIVQNLKCGGCAKTITTKLSELQNISEIEVHNDTSTVSFVTKDADDAFAVRSKLRSLGYPSVDDENSVMSKAKSFVSCATGKMK